MQSEVTTLIRQATNADAVNLAVLATQVWLDTYAKQGVRRALADYVLSEFSPERFMQRIAAPDQQILLAEKAQHLVGFARIALASPMPKQAKHHTELASFYVQPAFKGQGIGTHLLAAAKALAQAQSQALWFSVNAQNEKALAFYQHAGCIVVSDTYFELDGEMHLNRLMLASN
jgi:diamine N-acetyltransferase